MQSETERKLRCHQYKFLLASKSGRKQQKRETERIKIYKNKKKHLTHLRISVFGNDRLL